MPTLSRVHNMAQTVNTGRCRRRLWLPTGGRGSWWGMWWAGHRWRRWGRCWSGFYLCISLTAYPSTALINAGIHLISWVIWDSHVVPVNNLELEEVVALHSSFSFYNCFPKHIHSDLILITSTDEVLSRLIFSTWLFNGSKYRHIANPLASKTI